MASVLGIRPNYTPGALFYQVMPIVYAWAALVFVFFCGSRWLNFTTRRLPEANEAVLPFYVLHQPAIVVFAFFVVQWQMAILPKWALISALALGLTLAIYVFAIRPTPWLRWLFGMKPRGRTPCKGPNGGEQDRQSADALGGMIDHVDQAVPADTWREDPSGTRSGHSNEDARSGDRATPV